MSSEEEHQIRVIVLNENASQTAGLNCLKKSWHVKFVLAPSLVGKTVRLFTDCPLQKGSPFKRHEYSELKWVTPSKFKYDNSDRYVTFECLLPGTFHYYYTTNNSNEFLNTGANTGYLLVEPQLKFDDGEELPIDCIQCLTQLSKSLGNFEDWEGRLEISKHTGYNMIHFTPIQKLYHVSNSSYSITDHHKLNPLFGEGVTFDHIKQLVDKMSKEWKILSITDLVYNHAANDCEILKNHPDSAYNLINSPHLKPAFLLDSILMQFTKDAEQGLLEKEYGIPAKIEEHHLDVIQHYLAEIVIPKYRLHEFYMCDVKQILKEFRAQIKNLSRDESSNIDESGLKLIHNNYRRLESTVDMELAIKLYYHQSIEDACQALEDRLIYLNHLKMDEIENDLKRAISCCIDSSRYHFFESHGPRYPQISIRTPFVGNNFAYPNDEFRHPDDIEKILDTNNEDYLKYCMAHNGWVMNTNPLKNFAEDVLGPNVYLRRELIQWSDIVKLRFGDKYEDSPALWDYMKEYTRLIATTFHGARLDNCHSTPIHVAQYFMDYARKINPNFYVVGELFTGDENIDTIFVNQLGINSLVRESLNAWDGFEFGRLISRYGGDVLGTFSQSSSRFLRPTVPHAFFYDQTHDNPCPIERRSLEDVLPRSALVTMTCCAIGSNRGYDELVPHHIDVVHERRFYSKWKEPTGLIEARLILNRLHTYLCKENYSQILVDLLSSSVVVITRHNPQTHTSILLIAHTAFKPQNEHERIKSLNIQGHIDEILFEMNISTKHQDIVKNFQRNSSYINGLDNVDVTIREHVPVDQSSYIQIRLPANDQKLKHIEFNQDKFVPGTVIAFKISLLPNIKEAIVQLNNCQQEFTSSKSKFQLIVKSLSLIDLNRVLYRCSPEEIADENDFDVYGIPEHGKLNYCGLQGLMSELDKIKMKNDLKHPLCQNVKEGNWLIDYVANRLLADKSTEQLGQWYKHYFSYLIEIPHYLQPSYFDLIIRGSYTCLVKHAYEVMGTEFILQSSQFVKQLAMGSVQLCGHVKNARLPLLSPNLNDPKPDTIVDEHTHVKYSQSCPTLAAGLPNFSAGIWRNWGRDTFIAMRGLMLITGRYIQAKYLILGYGGCLRHALIPNLLGDVGIARYNARDAVWWWLHSISEYTRMVPNGTDILQDQIARLYPTDDSPMQLASGAYDQPLYEVIQEVLMKHVSKLKFRERNAGYQIDRVMTDNGFNNEIGIDLNTGFVYGGNVNNCGTWMDKMGSSEKAGNIGHPGSPRDGSAVELIGLCRSVLKWLLEMNKQGVYPYNSVDKIITFHEWIEKIDLNFEKYFWIGENDNSSPFINRHSIYKDTVNSTLKWSDYQFRPNFLVAAVVAPEMFNSTHIWQALTQVELILLGKYGIKTLDPSDLNYVGIYDNNDEGYDFKRAHGFNYHNGPEWVWLMGYYLRAKLYWAKVLDKDQKHQHILSQTIEHIQQILTNHQQFINANDWKGLTELTSENGEFCKNSCPVQAWSMSTLLETMYDLKTL
ncbi:unnamed protein product [Didymodactylos carnosus]|uniref:Glycogen debranching enzyme n=1 Tax=Didymodactylos carnosus TaxID=1234261 RepID=A0A814YMN9_9BILA|nr:unnamed protein product [Didymodactylos carnosus]CAF1231628.1 unnamed protein product [Didymodactylos carnosus]CAF3795260.1 unnamed protein product [Didymodactylos carnosus]CAF3994282.1 unnamed protein product [Didymodactylos carnosus]